MLTEQQKIAKEFGAFINRKFDELKDAVRNQRIVTDISGAAVALDKAAANLEAGSKELSKAIKSQDMGVIQKSLLMLAQSIATMAKSVGNVKPTDMAPTNRLLADVIKSVSKIKFEQKETDVSKLNEIFSIQKLILDAIKKNGIVKDRTDEIVSAIKGIEIKIPESMKLDKAQVSTIVHSGGGGATVSSAQKATSASVAMALANTQYSYKFPANTIGFRIKLRDQGELMTYSWQTGTMPTSGDGSAYSTLQQNSEIARDGLDIGGKTLYFQSDAATMVAEIESYQLA